MVCPTGGAADRTSHDNVRPPFIMGANVIDAIAERLGNALDAATATRMQEGLKCLLSRG